MADLQLDWRESSRGMRGAVHVRIFDNERQEWAVRTERPRPSFISRGEWIDGRYYPEGETVTFTARPIATPAKARAYAMRWKSHTGGRYTVEFSEVKD